jgi:apolipoprotein N-acyltransferase
MIFVLSFFSGCIAFLAFAPISFWPAPFIALFILNKIIHNRKLLHRLIISQVFGLGLLLPTQIWTGTYVGNMPWITLAVMQSFLFWPFAIRIPGKLKVNVWLFAFDSVIVELLLRTIPFTGFGWSRLSFTQINSPLSAIYPILGSAGVIFLVALFAANRRYITMSLIFIILLIANFLPSTLSPSGSIKIALVQGGVKNLGLDFNATPREVFNSHLNLTTQKLKANQVDLIIWPENSVDVDLFKFADVRESISDLSRNLDTPILVGGITHSNGDLRNISVLFNPQVANVYTKRYLTPFGEYIPMRSFVENFTDLTQEVEDFKAGKQSNLVSIDGISSQVFICYELLNDSLKNEVNTDFLIVQTNNATFGDTAQLDQELQIAKVRAIETGREVAYVSTTGVTSFINSDGSVKSSLPKFEPNVLIGSIETKSGQNLNQKLSIIPEIFSIFMVFLLLIRNRRFT